ncbi:formimidoylglutamase [Natrialbaceae archaeon AArc-T1-2]|uniref:formimidoylglutamase n=1 Tax=Natrialbaceae archaeon AArc-T1-2 TaxID=3053904 RepID=UPI00255A916F|nr:formimidoylglutamase [Natrialbaceae archaeon AArc-T1-2]WIV66111.1 formimidoylglutamase [Natrialbaceae archaeon AArc-T1-2]
MTAFASPPDWESPANDPNDETFGDVVEPTSLEDAGAYDAVLVGEPYDGAVIGRRGASEGPTAIREQLAGVKTHHFEAGPVRSVGDLGDLRTSGDVAAVQDDLEDATAVVHDLDALPVFLGGDNSLTVPNVTPLLEIGSVGAISFDAHLDCREVHDEPTSGTPYRQLHERGLDAFAVVGARQFETASAYARYVDRQGGTIVTAADVRRDPVAALERALEAVDGVDHLYVSLDVDALDATAAPGVSAPTPGGLASVDLYRGLFRVARDDRIAGVEVVECAPPLADGDRTAAAASRAVAHVLAGHTEGKR